MRHLDLTIDFETCGLDATAAPMQVAIVPWRREAETDPFTADDTGLMTEEEASRWPEPHVQYVDLRTCWVEEGFTFSPDTKRWWEQRSQAAKDAVCSGLAEPVWDVAGDIADYISRAAELTRAGSLCLWSHGTDVDIAILRRLCERYGIELEKRVPHTSLRDCRTVILEAAVTMRCRDINRRSQMLQELHENPEAATGEVIDDITENGVEAPGQPTPGELLVDPALAYSLYPPLPDDYARGSEAHDALYDATRSAWYTWQALKSLRQP